MHNTVPLSLTIQIPKRKPYIPSSRCTYSYTNLPNLDLDKGPTSEPATPIVLKKSGSSEKENLINTDEVGQALFGYGMTGGTPTAVATALRMNHDLLGPDLVEMESAEEAARTSESRESSRYSPDYTSLFIFCCCFSRSSSVSPDTSR